MVDINPLCRERPQLELSLLNRDVISFVSVDKSIGLMKTAARPSGGGERKVWNQRGCTYRGQILRIQGMLDFFSLMKWHGMAYGALKNPEFYTDFESENIIGGKGAKKLIFG